MLAWLPDIEELRLAAAFLAAAVACLAILSHRRTTARKNTLDFILNHELHDPVWLRLRLNVFPILQDPEKWGALVMAKSTPDKQDLLASLNHHEIVAVSIKHRALDRTSTSTGWGVCIGRTGPWHTISFGPSVAMRRSQAPLPRRERNRRVLSWNSRS